ncbi:tyrosine--tRNA ligase [Candidatus Karelsulcia muelleri]|uniref:tyrosine--tRNA ligase n=1 Tax=Candidatus Karelsulcia muelleri TaxID=336810 RepID=UPI002168EBB8|nr:tyrosine--tRNA ligase [Candidatus Karelsulcia muelleri]
MNNLIQELLWRGLIHDTTYSESEQRKNEIITLYTGFDPTYKSLHIGNLVAIIMLIHFKKSGDNIISVIGGGTGMIGDPSGKDGERIFKKKELLLLYIFCLKKQLSLYLDFQNNEIFNNYEWLKNKLFIEFTRDIGKYFTINYLLTKDSIKRRISNNNSISFTEFTYQLLQAYDFLYLYKEKNCSLQIGGSDQWGNITSGIELIRKKRGVKVNGLTFPLITKLDGSKFGKSENGENIWIDKNLTSPYKFYQFWINIADEQAKKYIKIYTFLKKEEIKEIIFYHENDPKLKLIQKKLADAVTIFIHGKKTFEKIKFISNIIFNKKKIINEINKNDIIFIYKNIPHKKIYLSKNIPIIDLLVNKSEFLKSKKEAIKQLKLNSISINKKKIDDKFILKKKNFISYILLQRGKKQFFMIKIV